MSKTYFLLIYAFLGLTVADFIDPPPEWPGDPELIEKYTVEFEFKFKGHHPHWVWVFLCFIFEVIFEV